MILTDPRNEASDTPRVDAVIRERFRNHEGWQSHPLTDLARTLERECNALREECERLRDWNMDRAGQLACTEQRISADNAKLRAELAEARKDSARLEDARNKVRCLTGYIEHMIKSPRSQWAQELEAVVKEANEYLDGIKGNENK